MYDGLKRLHFEMPLVKICFSNGYIDIWVCNAIRVCCSTSVIYNSEMFGSDIVDSHSSIDRCTLVMTVSS